MVCTKCGSSDVREERFVFMCGIFSKAYLEMEDREENGDREEDKDGEKNVDANALLREVLSIEAQSEIEVKICRDCGQAFLIKESYRQTRVGLEAMINEFIAAYKDRAVLEPDVLPSDLRRLIVEESE